MPRAITVVWMDDRIETYADAETALNNDVLHIHQYTGRMITGEHHLPISNIREWHPADQDSS